MAAWLEHAACQLQAVEQVFFFAVQDTHLSGNNFLRVMFMILNLFKTCLIPLFSYNFLSPQSFHTSPFREPSSLSLLNQSLQFTLNLSSIQFPHSSDSTTSTHTALKFLLVRRHLPTHSDLLTNMIPLSTITYISVSGGKFLFLILLYLLFVLIILLSLFLNISYSCHQTFACCFPLQLLENLQSSWLCAGSSSKRNQHDLKIHTREYKEFMIFWGSVAKRLKRKGDHIFRGQLVNYQSQSICLRILKGEFEYLCKNQMVWFLARVTINITSHHLIFTQQNYFLVWKFLQNNSSHLLFSPQSFFYVLAPSFIYIFGFVLNEGILIHGLYLRNIPKRFSFPSRENDKIHKPKKGSRKGWLSEFWIISVSYDGAPRRVRLGVNSAERFLIQIPWPVPHTKRWQA
ncbi:hypothetical protein VP01_210g8 [Puccinia sorghi]|uniref:Uncharacterized protein n=1 Tax=Puccinia sorghi TaxID=27349 RepID=A0A0L6VA89_9BASI|nr:hypothetical protein VP01_210g8 [Puccinia sorghi]